MKKFTIGFITFLTLLAYSSILSAQVTLTVDDPEGCATHTVNFTVESDNAYEYYYDFYGWTYSNSISNTYYNAGEYIEYVNVYDSDYNLLGSDTVIITVIEIPDYLNMSADDACPGIEIDFYLALEGTTYSWDFGDGATSAEATPSHAYTNTGTYTVSVTAENECGSNSLTEYIDIYSDLSIDGSYQFDVSPHETCIGKEIAVQTITYGYYSDIIHREIDFGDGTVYENDYVIDHLYGSNGEYTITATFTNSCGKDTVLKDTVRISDEPPFSGSPYLYGSPDEACTNENFYFYTYFDSDSYLWEYDDGTTGQDDDNDYHSFSTEGIHYVTLTVTDECGVDSSVVDSVLVNNNVPFQGYPSIYLSPEIGCPTEEFYFYASGFNSYLWNFGDGSTDTNYYAYHQYSSVGTYVVTLTVTDACGNDSTITDSVEVTDDLPFSGYPYIYLSPHIGCPGTLFSMSADYGYEDYHWDFGDGNTSAERYADHVYAAPGKYYITLTLTDECGIDSSIVDSVEVSDDLPFQGTPYLSINPTEVCPYTDVYFSTSSGYSAYEWSLGNGETSDMYYGTTEYTTTGEYIISVTITDVCGNDTVLFDTVYVVDDLLIPYADYYIDKHLVCPLEDVYFEAEGTGIVSVLWEFGDMNISKRSSTNHEYYKLGEFPVTLTMTNGCGEDTVFKDTIKVVDDKMIDGSVSMSISNDSVCPDTYISFYSSSDENLEVLWDFGDGNTASYYNVSHSYAATGTYEVTVTFTNICGKDTTLKDTVHIVDDVEISMVYVNHRLEVCIGEEVNMYVSGSNLVDADWVFEDGVTESGTNISRSFDAADTVMITVTVYNACGDDTTITSYIVIRDGIEIDSYISIDAPDITCPGNNVWFSFYCSDPFSEVLWDLGDGNTTNEESFSHVYSTIGKYYITLRLTNACGDDTSLTDSIEVVDDIGFSYINIYASRYVVCPNEEIWFSASGNAVSTYWEMGDGTTSLNSGLYHSYPDVGVYTVSVTLTNVCGGDSTKTLMIEVVDDIIIYEISAGAYKYHACPGEEIDFWVSGSFATTEWDFGDGSTSDDSHPDHAYDAVGIYDVSVTVSNYCGDQMTYYLAVYIENDVPIDDFWFGFNDRVCPDQEFEFYADGGFASYSWNLGDGNTSTEQNFYHSYSAAGTYNVTLTVTNECGNSATRTRTVVINDDLEIGDIWFLFPDEVCPNTEVTFYTSSSYASFVWIINGTTYNERAPKVSFSTAGTYDVELTATNYCGNSATINDEIVVATGIQIDEVDFDISPLTACPGDPISFESNNMYASATWDFADGSTSDEYNVSHSYAAVGTYEVSITVTNGCGMSATETQEVVIGSDVAADLDDDHYGTPEQVCVGDLTYFYITPSGLGTYSIDFGDGSPAVTETRVIESDGGLHDIAEHAYDEAGTYDVTFVYTNSCGNTFTDVIQIEVVGSVDFYPDVEIDEEFEDVDLCTETNFGFIASGGGTYVWDFGDGSDNMTETASFSIVEHEYLVKGSYTVSVTISNSCGDSETLTIDVEIVCGEDVDTTDPGPGPEPEYISLEELNGKISIYPNPSFDKLNIDFPAEISGTSEAIIYTLVGKEVLRQALPTISETINVSRIESGIYILEISTEVGTINKRILIK
ncbi:PKD domain-containing protein [Bacteroidota bacterium]